MFENYLLISKITPQTFDQYWLTLVCSPLVFIVLFGVDLPERDTLSLPVGEGDQIDSIHLHPSIIRIQTQSLFYHSRYLGLAKQFESYYKLILP